MGVGGVFVMDGALGSPEGGVRGGAVVSILGGLDLEGVRSDDDEATFAREGGSGTGGLDML